MTTRDLWKKHSEYLNPCDVQAGPAPQLVVTCRDCGVRLEAALLSPCAGDGEAHRVLLMMECPHCRATGQVRFSNALGRIPVAAQANKSIGMSVAASGPGYLSVRCASCDPRYGHGVLLVRHAVTQQELVLEGVSLGCGHAVELRLPRTTAFRVEGHRHGPQPVRSPRDTAHV